MQALERAEGGGIPGGGVLDVVAWQPDLLSRACKGAEEGNKPGVGCVGGSVTGDAVVGDTEAALFGLCLTKFDVTVVMINFSLKVLNSRLFGMVKGTPLYFTTTHLSSKKCGK